MKVSFRSLILPLVFVFMSGCSTTGKYVAVEISDKEKAIVYIYRPHSPPVLRTPEIRVNGSVIGDLSHWGYFGFTVDPGSYSVEVDWAWDTLIEDSTINFTAKAGETHYLRVASSMTGIYLVGSPVMTFGGSSKFVSRKEAMIELEKCAPVAGFDQYKIAIGSK